MTLVLLTPIGLDEGCWQWVNLPEMPTVKHVFPGFGRRPRRDSAPDMAELALEVVDSYEGPLDLVGVSMGGMVAQNMAVGHPERVRSLLTACTGAATNAQAMLGRAEAAETQGMRGVLQTTLDRWFTPEALGEEPEPPGVTYARQTLLALEPGSFADGWRAIATHDVRDRLAEIGVPTTCIAGDRDAASPIARGEEIADRVPNSRLVILEGPHMMHLENPAGLSAAIAEHLRWALGD